MKGEYFPSGHSGLGNRRWRSVPLLVSASRMLLLAWTSRTNTASEAEPCVCVWGEEEGVVGGWGGHKEKKPSLASVRSL